MISGAPVRTLSDIELKRELGHIAKILGSGEQFGSHPHARVRGAALLREACKRIPNRKQGPADD